ncbi:Putative acetyltransferase [Stieleria neptunia]|uniref:Acetyltransferase n=2 Tax=Stieleria neptunia TaxID=2527979 RepID=A0A518HTN0_9BACT|nr:Putative acetyltransferase [Stieleria neptunia]
MLRSIYRKLLAVRSRFMREWRSRRTMRCVASCKSRPNVNAKCSFTRTTHLGHNTNFNGVQIVGGGKVVIGDNFHSGTEVRMITQNHRYDDGDSIPYDSKEYLLLDIHIGDNVWIGDRVILLGGITIGEGSIIQAGSVVVSDIPRCSIAGGHPAKVFKMRDVDHYEKLKSAGKFA